MRDLGPVSWSVLFTIFKTPFEGKTAFIHPGQFKRHIESGCTEAVLVARCGLTPYYGMSEFFV